MWSLHCRDVEECHSRQTIDRCVEISNMMNEVCHVQMFSFGGEKKRTDEIDPFKIKFLRLKVPNFNKWTT